VFNTELEALKTSSRKAARTPGPVRRPKLTRVSTPFFSRSNSIGPKTSSTWLKRDSR